MAKKYIDADRLKQTIADNVYLLQDAFNSRDYGMFWTGGIEKAIDEQPAVDIEPRWIPCSERMPDKEGLYLITCVDDSGAPFADASLYDPPTDRRGAIWDFPNVVAWMERPEPYKEGAEE